MGARGSSEEKMSSSELLVYYKNAISAGDLLGFRRLLSDHAKSMDTALAEALFKEILALTLSGEASSNSGLPVASKKFLNYLLISCPVALKKLTALVHQIPMDSSPREALAKLLAVWQKIIKRFKNEDLCFMRDFFNKNQELPEGLMDHFFGILCGFSQEDLEVSGLIQVYYDLIQIRYDIFERFIDLRIAGFVVAIRVSIASRRFFQDFGDDQKKYANACLNQLRLKYWEGLSEEVQREAWVFAIEHLSFEGLLPFLNKNFNQLFLPRGISPLEVISRSVCIGEATRSIIRFFSNKGLILEQKELEILLRARTQPNCPTELQYLFIVYARQHALSDILALCASPENMGEDNAYFFKVWGALLADHRRASLGLEISKTINGFIEIFMLSPGRMGDIDGVHVCECIEALFQFSVNLTEEEIVSTGIFETFLNYIEYVNLERERSERVETERARRAICAKISNLKDKVAVALLREGLPSYDQPGHDLEVTNIRTEMKSLQWELAEDSRLLFAAVAHGSQGLLERPEDISRIAHDFLFPRESLAGFIVENRDPLILFEGLHGFRSQHLDSLPENIISDAAFTAVKLGACDDLVCFTASPGFDFTVQREDFGGSYNLLELAVIMGQKSMVEYLLAHSPTFCLPYEALYLALFSGRADVFSVLVEHFCKQLREQQRISLLSLLLCVCCYEQSTQLGDLLVRAGANYFRNVKPQEVEDLIAKKMVAVDLNSLRRCGSSESWRKGVPPIPRASFLVARTDDLSANSSTFRARSTLHGDPFYEKNDLEIASWKIAAQGEYALDRPPNYAYLYLVKSGQLPKVQALLPSAPQPLLTDILGELVKYLPKPSECEAYLTILDAIAERDPESINRVFLEGTPLHYAVLVKNKYAFNWLLGHEAAVNIQDSFGRTPLHLAASQVDDDSIIRLCEAGADPGIVDHGGKLPVSYWISHISIREYDERRGTQDSIFLGLMKHLWGRISKRSQDGFFEAWVQVYLQCMKCPASREFALFYMPVQPQFPQAIRMFFFLIFQVRLSEDEGAIVLHTIGSQRGENDAGEINISLLMDFLKNEYKLDLRCTHPDGGFDAEDFDDDDRFLNLMVGKTVFEVCAEKSNFPDFLLLLLECFKERYLAISGKSVFKSILYKQFSKTEGPAITWGSILSDLRKKSDPIALEILESLGLTPEILQQFTAGDQAISERVITSRIAMSSRRDSRPDLPNVSGSAALLAATSHSGGSASATVPIKVTMIPYASIKFTGGSLLGAGGFGEVREATWANIPVAVKKLKSARLSEQAIQEFRQEAERHLTLNHLHIVRLYGICVEEGYHMVMELMESGSLYDVLRGSRELPWELRLRIAKDIAVGLAYLHEQNILHRDLKSLNVLLDDRLSAKLADFGLSKVKSETTSLSSGSGAAGTLSWMAPELFERGKKHTEASDVYAMAIIFWELASRRLPFANAVNPSVIPLWVARGDREDIPAETPTPFSQLIRKAWAQRAEDRPTAARVIEVLESGEALPQGRSSGLRVFS